MIDLPLFRRCSCHHFCFGAPFSHLLLFPPAVCFNLLFLVGLVLFVLTLNAYLQYGTVDVSSICFSRNFCLCFVIITALRTSTRFNFSFTWTEDAVWQNRFPLNNINACWFLLLVQCAQTVLKLNYELEIPVNCYCAKQISMWVTSFPSTHVWLAFIQMPQRDHIDSDAFIQRVHIDSVFKPGLTMLGSQALMQSYRNCEVTWVFD